MQKEGNDHELSNPHKFVERIDLSSLGNLSMMCFFVAFYHGYEPCALLL